MRKAYLFICALSFTFFSFAQIKTFETPIHIIDDKDIFDVTPSVNPNTAAVAPFWSNDFSNPNDWTMVDLIYGGLQNWVITSQGPQGAYSNAMGPIASTSGGNFALFDSDYLNNAYNPQEATLTYNGSVDCSNYQYVNINFESYHRKFHDSVFVEVSTDPNFGTYDRFEVHAGQAVNVTSDNPEYVSINISSVASYQAAVYFRFHYEGEWDYAWMVDDVSFSETPENALAFSDETYGGWWIGYQATNDLGSDFTFYPMTQVAAQPYRLEGVITNIGIQNQNNTMLNVEVEDPIGTTTLLTSNSFVSASGQKDTVTTSSNFTPTNMGIHNFSFWASSNDTVTDTIVRSTIVTDTIYGLDFDWESDGGNYAGYDLGVDCGGQVLGNAFDIYASDDVTSISFHINEDSRPGATLKVELYEMDGTNDPILLSESDDYTLTNADIDSWKTLSFNDPVPVYAGFRYLAAVHGEAHPTDTSFVSYTLNNNSSTWGQDNGCDWNSANPIGSWYTLSRTMLIRMNFGEMSSTDISDKSQDNLAIYPNPSNGFFTLELGEYTQTTITVTDVLGSVIYADDMLLSSKHILDLSQIKKGIYFININKNGNVITEKITIQ